MGKHIIFSTLLNILLIVSVIIGYYGFKMNNLFIVILCAAAFGLTVFYKIKHTKAVQKEMKYIAELKVQNKNKRKK
jgi:Na+/serine symporter